MNFSDDRPIYLQIADDVRRMILDGTLTAGDQLMSTTQYASAYRINPATANKAFAMLVADGVIEKRRGIGMFVTATAHDTLRAEGRATYLEKVLTPALAHGINLGLSKDEILALISQHFDALPGKQEDAGSQDHD